MLDYTKLPPASCGGMKRYIEDGIPPGSFLQAVLSNDLVEAFAYADTYSRMQIEEYANFLYNELPGRGSNIDLWGSRKVVEEWIKTGGLHGLRAAQPHLAKTVSYLLGEQP
jgi:hypothetical protein